MTKICYPLVCIALPGIVGVSLLAQNTKTSKDFLIDANRPFVYVKFDHIGLGEPRSADEPNSRIWLRLRNNCRIPIVVRANGVPDDSPKDEVGLQYDVVRNPEIPGPIMLFPPSQVTSKSESEKATDQQESEAKAEEVPRGYMFHVASRVSIEPGREILFSMPVSHLSERWHVEIPFDFELPHGKGPLLSNTVGLPIMAVHYTVWDLPQNSQSEILKK